MDPKTMMGLLAGLGASAKPNFEPRTKYSGDRYPEKKPVPMVTRPKFSKIGKLTNHQRVILGRSERINLSVNQYIAAFPRGYDERKNN
jgi:hypothetical protein